uniref:Immunoglobulin domain-containing protein n=1 Tax=Cyprinus carpio carpio TaxID=630221 RepID=A0A9J8AX62_CYPCA
MTNLNASDWTLFSKTKQKHLVQPGHSTTLQCFTPDDGHFKVFWLKLHNSSAPVFVALAESDKTGIIVEENFKDPSKYRLTWNKLSFNLSVLNIEQTDIAVYYCGIIIYNTMIFGNGTRLSVFVWPTLMTIIVVSILLSIILCYFLKKHRAGNIYLPPILVFSKYAHAVFVFLVSRLSIFQAFRKLTQVKM